MREAPARQRPRASRSLIAKRVAAAGLVLAALTFTQFYGVRAYRALVLLQTAQTTGVLETSALRGWMTLDYLAATYAVDAVALRRDLEVGAESSGALTLREVAALKAVDTFEIVRQVQASIVKLADRRLPEASAQKSESQFERLEAAFLEAVLIYGYPALALTLFLGSLGLPVPTGLATSIAGAAANHGGLLPAAAFGLAVVASLAGDVLAYGLGVAIPPATVDRYGRWVGYVPATRKVVERSFARWGAITVFLTRTLASHFSTAASLLAGLQRYPFAVFAAYSALGRAVWTAAYFALGYLVGTDLGAATGFLEYLGLTMSAVIVGGASGAWLWRSAAGRTALGG